MLVGQDAAQKTIRQWSESQLSGGYYGLRMSTLPPQCVEIFSLPL